MFYRSWKGWIAKASCGAVPPQRAEPLQCPVGPLNDHIRIQSCKALAMFPEWVYMIYAPHLGLAFSKHFAQRAVAVTNTLAKHGPRWITLSPAIQID